MFDVVFSRCCGNRARLGIVLIVGSVVSSASLRAQRDATTLAPEPSRSIAAFFPPPPPILGDPIVRRSKAPFDDAAPAELAPFLNEPFYAALSLCLAEKTLTPELRREVETYRAAKATLQTELIAQLYSLRESEPAPRLQTLEDFARVQDQRIRDLEQQSEHLRSELAVTTANSSVIQKWKTDPPNSADTGSRSLATDNLPASIASAFAEGFSPAQRRLLREMGIEAKIESRSAGAPTEPPLFFSPESARIRLPAGLSPELTAMIAAYSLDKNALKTELTRTLSEENLNSPASQRLTRQALAENQAARIEKLDTSAEKIRRALAGTSGRFNYEALSFPSLPPELEARIATYRKEKVALQKALLTRVEALSRSRENPAPNEEKTRQVIAAFTQENSERYAALDQEREILRGEIAKLASTGNVVVKGPYADALSQRFNEALQQIDVWRNYREYQTAVFEPGLSPGQRRLLFDAAVERLASPSSTGETSKLR